MKRSKNPLFCIITKKQPARGVLRKRCSVNMRQIYRRTPMPKCELGETFTKQFSSCTLREKYPNTEFFWFVFEYFSHSCI